MNVSVVIEARACLLRHAIAKEGKLPLTSATLEREGFGTGMSLEEAERVAEEWDKLPQSEKDRIELEIHKIHISALTKLFGSYRRA